MKEPQNPFVKFFKVLYEKLFVINDSPQRIAIGLGLGVFTGVIPGTGPIAALFLAVIFKVNRASALIGSALTNTWLSIPVFLLAIKAGAMITGIRFEDLDNQWHLFLKSFHWAHLLQTSIYKIIFPILAGYFCVALCIGAIAYVVAFLVVSYAHRARMSQKSVKP